MIFIRSSGGYRGRNVAATLPAWLAGAAVNQWGTIPDSQLDASGVMLSGGDAVVGSWNGAIVTTAGFYHGTSFIPGPCFLIGQTGHTLSYDEFYGFGPMNGTPSWRLLRGRTSPVVQNAEVDGSGNRVSCHGYAGWVYPGASRNEMLRIGGNFRYSDAGSDTAMGRWRMNVSDPANNQPWTTYASTTAGSSPAYAAVYDSAQDKVWYHPAARNEIGVFDVAGDTISQVGGKTPNPGDDTAGVAYDQTRGLMCMAGNGFSFFRTNSTANDYYTPTTSGSAPTLTGAGNYGAVIWDPIDDRFVFWMNSGKTLAFLTPPASSPYAGGNAWVWSSTTPGSGSTPSAMNSTGTFGRFAYCAIGSARVYLLLNSAAESMYFYRAA